MQARSHVWNALFGWAPLYQANLNHPEEVEDLQNDIRREVFPERKIKAVAIDFRDGGPDSFGTYWLFYVLHGLDGRQYSKLPLFPLCRKMYEGHACRDCTAFRAEDRRVQTETRPTAGTPLAIINKGLKKGENLNMTPREVRDNLDTIKDEMRNGSQGCRIDSAEPLIDDPRLIEEHIDLVPASGYAPSLIEDFRLIEELINAVPASGYAPVLIEDFRLIEELINALLAPENALPSHAPPLVEDNSLFEQVIDDVPALERVSLSDVEVNVTHASLLHDGQPNPDAHLEHLVLREAFLNMGHDQPSNRHALGEAEAAAAASAQSNNGLRNNRSVSHRSIGPPMNPGRVQARTPLTPLPADAELEVTQDSSLIRSHRDSEELFPGSFQHDEEESFHEDGDEQPNNKRLRLDESYGSPFPDPDAHLERKA